MFRSPGCLNESHFVLADLSFPNLTMILTQGINECSIVIQMVDAFNVMENSDFYL